MYYGRKKGIIITIIVIILLLVLAIGGILLYLYTDLFKSNETLFLKYISQTTQSMKYETNEQLEDVLKNQEQNPYEVKGTLNFNYEGEQNTNAEILKQLQLIVNSNVNKPEEKSYSKATLVYQDQNLFNIEYANSNNIYALKSDEIVTAFVGIRNENLKVLAQKLGISDTTKIPDSIEFVDYEELLEISEEEKKHISDTYLPVIIESIPKEKYTKQSNIPITKEGVEYNTNSYRLDLSSEEISNVLVKVLQTLQQDSITLNLITTKAKLLNLSEEYTQINKLTQVIQEKIDDINDSRKLPEEGLSIIVYEEKGKTILTEFIIKNNAKITIYANNENEKNNIYAMLENLSSDEDFKMVEMQITNTKTTAQSNTEILINKDNNIGIELYITNTGLASDGNVSSNCEIVYNQDNNKYVVNYEQELNFVENENNIVNLDNTNCAILNDYPTDQLSMLIQLITAQTTNVLYQKIQQMGIIFANNQEQQIQINQENINAEVQM